MFILKCYLLTPTFLPMKGGQEELVHRLAVELAKKHDVIVVTNTKGIETKPWGTFQSDSYKVMRVFSFPIKGLNLISSQVMLPLLLIGEMKRNFPDVIHLFEPFHMGYASLLLKRVFGVPLVLTLIGMNTYDPFSRNYSRFRGPISKIMNNVDVVTASTRELFKRAKWQGYQGEARIIPHCVDTSRFYPMGEHIKTEIRNKHEIDDTQKLVVSIQRLDKRKKTGVLVSAAKYVLSKMPNVRFIIGGTGPEQASLEQQVQEMGLSKNVEMIGYIPDSVLPKYYSAADLFALHTLYEGFGIVVIEAMACGTPVVTTDTGGLREIVESNAAGIVVRPDSSIALGDAIMKILNDSELQAQFAANARRVCVEKFDTSEVVREYLRLYSETLQERK